MEEKFTQIEHLSWDRNAQQDVRRVPSFWRAAISWLWSPSPSIFSSSSSVCSSSAPSSMSSVTTNSSSPSGFPVLSSFFCSGLISSFAVVVSLSSFPSMSTSLPSLSRLQTRHAGTEFRNDMLKRCNSWFADSKWVFLSKLLCSELPTLCIFHKLALHCLTVSSKIYTTYDMAEPQHSCNTANSCKFKVFLEPKLAIFGYIWLHFQTHVTSRIYTEWGWAFQGRYFYSSTFGKNYSMSSGMYRSSGMWVNNQPLTM